MNIKLKKTIARTYSIFSLHMYSTKEKKKKMRNITKRMIMIMIIHLIPPLALIIVQLFNHRCINIRRANFDTSKKTSCS